MTLNILRVDSSMRRESSVSRDLNDKVIEKLKAEHDDVTVVERDLLDGVSHITPDWIGSNFTPEADRSDDQRNMMGESDRLIAEVKAADVIVVAAPVYNFSVPAALKAWIDQICRAGITFRYTENGPEGLLEGKKAIVTYTSGGVPMGSEVDFNSGYMKHVLGFIGIHDVQFVSADRLMVDPDASLAKASSNIEELAA
jgi:FMN-dependent NADH-azoreductase